MANPPRGGHAKQEVSYETARLPKPEHARRPRSCTSQEQTFDGSGVHWCGGCDDHRDRAPEGRHLGGAYRSESIRVADGERWGDSATTVAVRFTVRPVIVLVIDGNGAACELWTNIPGRPTAAQLAGFRVRLGSVRGPDLALSRALRSAATTPLSDARWGEQGRVWQR